MCLSADPVVACSIPTRSHTFVEIDREIISMVILLPSFDSGRGVVNYKRKHVHEVLLAPPPPKKKVCPDMTIAVDWDVKQQTKLSPMLQ